MTGVGGLSVSTSGIMATSCHRASVATMATILGTRPAPVRLAAAADVARGPVLAGTGGLVLAATGAVVVVAVMLVVTRSRPGRCWNPASRTEIRRAHV